MEGVFARASHIESAQHMESRDQGKATEGPQSCSDEPLDHRRRKSGYRFGTQDYRTACFHGLAGRRFIESSGSTFLKASDWRVEHQRVKAELIGSGHKQREAGVFVRNGSPQTSGDPRK